MNQFELLQKRLTAAQKAEQRVVLEQARVAARAKGKAWDSPDDRAEFLKQEYQQERYKLVKSLCQRWPDCPTCGRRVLNLRSWVVSKDKTLVMCRACHHRAVVKGVEIPERITYDLALFTKPVTVVKWSINGELLAVMREKLGVSQYEFAEKAGWSQSYQRDLECQRQERVLEETARVILSVFQNYDIDTNDMIPPEN